jgi:multiple sugar transport system ATP-binding protein
VDKRVIFGVRPENIHDEDFVPPNIDVEKVGIKVDVTELMGNEIFLHLVSGKNTFVARVDPRSSLRVGQNAHVMFDMDNFHIFDAESEEAIK